MPSGNNDITLTVGMETSDVTQAADALSKKLETIFNKASGKKLSASTKSLLQQMDTLSTRMDKIRQSMADMEGQSFDNSRFIELDEALQKAQDRVVDLQTKLAAIEQQGQNTGSGLVLPPHLQAQYSALTRELHNADAEAQALYDELSKTPATIAGEETQEYQDLADQLNNVINKLTVYRARLRETKDGVKLDTSGWQRLANVLTKITLSFSKLAFTTVVRGLRATSSAALSAAKNLAKLAGTKIKQGISKLGGSLFGLRSNVESANDGFKRGLKIFIRYAFGVRSLFFLIRRLRTLLLQGLQGFGEAYAPFGQTIQSFKSALNELKGSFISAFAPVASTVIPILNTLMSALSKVLNLIGMLFAALRGQTSYIKAQVVPATESAASSAGSAADAAEKYKKTIAGFDDVEILQSPNSSSGGGGGGGGGADSGGWSVEELPISSAISDFANTLKELIENQDWDGLGEFLAEKVNSVFTKLNNAISWENIGDKITNVVNAITTTMNSLVDNIDWDLIGKTVGSGVNTLVNTWNLLFDGFDFVNLGEKLATGVGGLFDRVDWAALGKAVTQKFKALWETIYGFVSKLEWGDIGTAIGEFINGAVENIDLGTVASAVAKTLNGIKDSISNFGETVDWNAVSSEISDFFRTIFEEWDVDDFISEIGTVAADIIGALADAAKQDRDKWKTFGENLAKGLKEVPWKDILTDIAEIVADTFVSLLIGFITEFLPDGIKKRWEELGWLPTTGSGGSSSSAESSGGHGGTGGTFEVPTTAVLTGARDEIPTEAKISKDWLGKFNKAADEIPSGDKEVGNVSAHINGFVDQIPEKAKTTSQWNAEHTKTTAKWKSGLSWQTTDWIAQHTIASRKWRSNLNWTTKDWTAQHSIVTRKWRKNTSWTTSDWTAKMTKTDTTALKPSQKKVNVTGVITNLSGGGGSVRFDVVKAMGGVFSKGVWRNIPQYARGTLRAGGSMFIAGEAGPEVVGHIGGRTEVLNQSQLAATMYTAIYSALTQILKQALVYIVTALYDSANAVIDAVNNFGNMLPTIIPTTISIPEIATGFVVPSMAQIATTQQSNELLANAVDAINQNAHDRLTNDELERIIERVIRRTLNIQFYIGDEQLARHANAGNDKLALRYNSAT